MSKPTFQIVVERRVPLEEMTLRDVTVLPEYFAVADDIEDALGEFYWHVPIENHAHFDVRATVVDPEAR